MTDEPSVMQSDLAEREQSVLAEDKERWAGMTNSAHLNDWLAFAPGLSIRRQRAMRIANTNKPEGRQYAGAFHELLRRDGLDTMSSASISAVLWLSDRPERMQMLRQILEEISPGERARLNSPITARQRVDSRLKAPGMEMRRKSSTAGFKERLAEKDRTIAELQAKLGKRDGSLFDLTHDTPKDIGGAIVRNVTAGKAKAISDAINTHLKQRSSKPAG
jgi:hypothetical protein